MGWGNVRHSLVLLALVLAGTGVVIIALLIRWRHWVYVYVATPIGFLLLWRPVVYVGESNDEARRHGEHMASAWWRDLAFRRRLVILVPGRRAGMVVERVLVAVLRPAANRKHNRRGGVSRRTVAARRRFLATVTVTVAVAALVVAVVAVADGWGPTAQCC